MRWNGLPAILFFACQTATAQFSLSPGAGNSVTIDTTVVNQPHAVDPAKFPVASFIVPGALIIYGFAAYHIDATTDLSENIRDAIHSNHPNAHTNVDTYLQFAPAAAVYGLNAIGIKGKNGLFDRSMIYLLSNVIMNATVYTVKNVTHELRPDSSDYYSFPSGHTAEAFLSAEFLYQEYKEVSPWYGIAGYGVAAAVGYLRMYNDKHWFHDVVAGAGFGIASTKLAYWLYPKIKRLFSGNKPLNTMVFPSYNNHIWSISLVSIR